MSALSRFEQTLERLVEGSVFRVLGGDLQPVEIAKRLVRSMENGREVGLGGLVAPNYYDVRLSPKDYARFADRRASLEWELADYLIESAGQRGLRLERRPTVRLAPSDDLRRHQIEIQARYADEVPVAAEAAATGLTSRLQVGPRLVKPLPLLRLIDPLTSAVVQADRLPFALGRTVANDFVIADRRVSRHHALIKEVEGRLCLADLDSTNGTFVNGRPVGQTVLADGDTISLGGYTLTVEIGLA